jgi:hypothetical protein
LSDQGSNLDFLESKSSVLPVTPSDSFSASDVLFEAAKVQKERYEARGRPKKNKVFLGAKYPSNGYWLKQRQLALGNLVLYLVTFYRERGGI